MTVYVAEQQKSFAMQQCMLISEAYLKATQQQQNQVVILMLYMPNLVFYLCDFFVPYV